jgi:hypothetical protein
MGTLRTGLNAVTKRRPRTKNKNIEGLGRVPGVGGVPRYRRRGLRASPGTPPPSAAFAATSRLRLPNVAARRRRQPTPDAANRQLLPRAAARHGPPWPVVRRRPSSVVRRRPSSSVAVRRRPHRPPSPVVARRRSSPTVARRRRSPSSAFFNLCEQQVECWHSLRRCFRYVFVLRSPHTAAHGDRDPSPDSSTSTPFVAVSASADFLSSDSCVRPLSAHAGVVRLTVVTCGRRSRHRGLGWIVVTSPPSSAKKNWSLAPLWGPGIDVQTPVFLRLD